MTINLIWKPSHLIKSPLTDEEEGVEKDITLQNLPKDVFGPIEDFVSREIDNKSSDDCND